MMQYFLLKPKWIIIFLIPSLLMDATFSRSIENNCKQDTAFVSTYSKSTISLYYYLQLDKLGLQLNIFDKAIHGWRSLNQQHCLQKPSTLTIIDLSQSSNKKRIYILDLVKRKLVFHTLVAHGRNSGNEFAIAFANKMNSFKSSLGFYVTGTTYYGDHGLSMRLKGIEKGINDGAEERGIVMHGANYVSEAFIKECGRLGRSEGCPAVPKQLCTPIVQYIKDGSCLFIYYPDAHYLSHSLLLE